MRHRRWLLFGLTAVIIAGGLGGVFAVRADDQRSSKLATVESTTPPITTSAPMTSLAAAVTTQVPTTVAELTVPAVALRRDAPPNKWTSYVLFERPVTEADIATEVNKGRSLTEARITIALREALKGPRGNAALSGAPYGDPRLLEGALLSNGRVTIVLTPDLPNVMNISGAEAGAVFNIILLGTVFQFPEVNEVVFTLAADCQAWVAAATEEEPCHVYSRVAFAQFAMLTGQAGV